jgi:hypothetical protein
VGQKWAKVKLLRARDSASGLLWLAASRMLNVEVEKNRKHREFLPETTLNVSGRLAISRD